MAATSTTARHGARVAPAGSSSIDENCDMEFIDIREHIKYLKYGYGRASDQLNIQIRSGTLTREEALKVAIDIDGKISNDNIEKFCDYVGIKRNYFNTLVDRFVNKDLFVKTNDNWELIYGRH